jgi:predicted metal-dependent phosphotriesterase family hydrolase
VSVEPRRTVQTVTGPLSVDELGLTLVHEHLIIDMYEPSLNALGVLLDEGAATDELALFGDAGGRTVVDQTTVGLNPDFEALRRISEASGVRIVAGTGVYWRRFRPAWVETMTETELTDLFVAELTEGRGPTRIRAGIIGEIATGHRDVDDVEGSVLRAAAAAQRATGAPIATHALFTRIGLEQLDILEAAGADLGAVLVGHADTCPDERYHGAILERGAWLGIDTVGQLDKTTDDWRADRIAALAELGHLGRILVSSDVCKRPALTRNGGGGYAHVIRDFVPRLTLRGFGEAEIRQLLVDNPRRLFEAAAQPG